MKIQIINGPNLNLLGVREPGIYGSESFEVFLPKLQERYPDIEIDYYQSNVEGELINKMQEVGFSCDGIVLNAGAYTHTSIALHDCIRSLRCPVIEVHISNVHQREEFRHKSMISAACKGVICGFGLDSYRAGARLSVSSVARHQHLYVARTNGQRTPAGTTAEDAGTDDTSQAHPGGGHIQWLQRTLHGRGTGGRRQGLYLRDQR